MKTGFLEESEGVKSSVRLSIFILLINGIIALDAVIAVGLWELMKYQKTSLMGICLAAGTLFVSLIGPCITWKTIKDKSEEVKTN